MRRLPDQQEVMAGARLKDFKQQIETESVGVGILYVRDLNGLNESGGLTISLSPGTGWFRTQV